RSRNARRDSETDPRCRRSRCAPPRCTSACRDSAAGDGARRRFPTGRRRRSGRRADRQRRVARWRWKRRSSARQKSKQAPTVCGVSRAVAASSRTVKRRAHGLGHDHCHGAALRRPLRRARRARAPTAMSDVSEDARANAARRSLELLTAQADVVRAELAQLRRELAQVKEELSNLRTTQVLEVNAELVQAAVHADSVAQTAVSSLDELARSTQHDELTGAPTRALLLDRLENAIAMAGRRSTRVGVIFVDLDGFKQINDTLGHAVGDQVLQLATRRLESSVRESDSVSRHGGDEFVVLLAELAKPSDAAAVAQKMIETLQAPALIGPHRVAVSASLGISVYPEDGDDPITLIECADAAMYRAKRAGPGGYAFCSDIAEGTHREGRAADALPHRRPESALA